MSKRFIPLLVVAVVAAALGLWAAQRLLAPASPATPALPAPRALTLFPTPRALPDFRLQQADGTALTPDTLKGHWTLVFLGYTHCPDVCPTTLTEIAGAQKQWAALPEANRPRVLFVSADPERDHPETVARYAHAFHPDTLAATAPLPQLQDFARALSLVFMKTPGPSGDPADYSIDHSAAFVLLDPSVRMAGVVQPPFDVKGIAADLKALSTPAR
ncbi:SCO family protein [Thermomonas sp.]|uniref:SCO family protein n=1 Tax=Thermomonas sp. TaxID=1971895 RepID=UPI001AD2EB47|nr:SCO family protein [Xanthomonadales bacterium]MBN8768090.1 SCO family protein [Stenotrophomonas sp.]